MPGDMHLFVCLRIRTVDVIRVPEHGLVNAVRLPNHVRGHTTQLGKLHLAHRVGIRRPGGPLLQDANPVPARHTLVLLPPAVSKLCKLRVRQTLSEGNDSARLRRVEEEVPRPLGSVLSRVDISQNSLYRAQPPVRICRVRIAKLDDFLRHEWDSLTVGPGIHPPSQEVLLVRYRLHAVWTHRPYLQR